MTTSAAAPTKSPSLLQMVKEAIATLGGKGGASSQAIKKYLQDNCGVDVQKKAKSIRNALNSGVDKGELIRTKGKGAAGTFKIDTAKENAAAKAKAAKEKERLKAKKEREIKADKAKKAKMADKAKKAKKVKKPAPKKSPSKAASKKNFHQASKDICQEIHHQAKQAKQADQEASQQENLGQAEESVGQAIEEIKLDDNPNDNPNGSFQSQKHFSKEILLCAACIFGGLFLFCGDTFS